MSTDGHDCPAPRRTISFTPALPDGVGCPWTRRRQTRWWLVVPVNLMTATLVALFGTASTHGLGEVPASLWRAGAAFFVAWDVTWLVWHSHPDHLEMALPEGFIVVRVSWVVRTALHQVVSAFDGMSATASWVVMTDAFLLVFLSGWRWFYGYARAHDSLTPRPVARRFAEQGGKGTQPRGG